MGDGPGSRGDPAEFRRPMLALDAAGRAIGSLATDLGISEQTNYTRLRPERMDTGRFDLDRSDRAQLQIARSILGDYVARETVAEFG